MDEEPKIKPTGHQTFRLGDSVRIMSGPFVSFTKVAIFGRNEPVRLNFSDVENISDRKEKRKKNYYPLVQDL